MKKNIFLTTRYEGMWKFIANICKNHFENEFKLNVELKKIYKKDVFKIDLKKILFIFKNISKKSFYDDYKFLKTEYMGCEIGRHALAATYSHLNCHLNSTIKNIYKIYYFVYGVLLIDYIHNNKAKIKSAFIDHGVYLNGILINYFSLKNIRFYTNSSPYGIYFKNSKFKKISFQNLIKVKYPKNKKKFKFNKNRIFKWPWVFNKQYFNIKKNDLENLDYVIYCHAFTDGLLSNGFDGFIRMDDWLKFTIDELLKRNSKILVKIHPNFHKYNKHFRSSYEIKIFNNIKKKYKNFQNIKFIDYPILNKKIMNSIDRKKTILITHHGTPILEGVASGFKIISSEMTRWDRKFKLSNSWSNRKEYKKILNKNISELKHGSMNDLKKLSSEIFKDKFGVHGKEYFEKLLKNKPNQKILNKIEKSIFSR